jgi:predicted dehydrogenase
VLCEKPLALNAADARAMYEKALSAGVTHMTNFTNHWRPWYRYVKELIEQDAIGTCYHCSFEQLGSYGRSTNYAWRFDRARANGILGDLGSHMIDLARWFVGDVTAVCADMATFVKRDPPGGGILEPANDSAVLALRFAGGAHGIIQVSAVAQTGERGQTHRIILHGERGAIEVDATTFDAEVRIVGEQGRIEELTVPDRFWGDVDRSMPPRERFLRLLATQPVAGRLFVDAILDGGQVVPSFHDGLEAQVVMDAAFRSQAEARWVRPGSQ